MDKKYLYQFNLTDQPIGTWLYAYGLLASKERKFFKESQIQQLYQAKSEQHLLNLIREANYNGDTVDEALNHSELEDFELLRTSNPNYDLITLLLSEKDAHNLKVILRAQLATEKKIVLTDLMHLFVGPFLTKPENMLDYLRGETAESAAVKNQVWPEDDIPAWIQKTIQEAIADYNDYYDPARVDHIVDQNTAQRIEQLLIALKSDWLTTFFNKKQDYLNLEILFRCRSLNLDENYFHYSIIHNGTIPKEKWHEFYPLSDEELKTELGQSDLDKFAEFVENYHELGKASEFTKVQDSLLFNYLREAAVLGPGIEMTAAYFLIRSLERKTIRVARAVVNNNFSAQRVSQLMRPGF